jgi:hypothetical protein
MKDNAKMLGDVITDIVLGDDVTDVTDELTLSSGQIRVWNGQPCYDPIDSAEGVKVGATLVAVELRYSHKGDGYLHYKFE